MNGAGGPAYSLAVLATVATLTMSGCGYKTDPVPPQSVVPEAVNDLRYILTEEGAQLSWSFPRNTLDGRDVEEILNFELFRAEIPLDDYCGSCPIPFDKPLDLPGGVREDVPGQKVEYVSGLLRSGNKYFFKVRSRTSWWAASADSNIVSFVYHIPAVAPEGVSASLEGEKVRLSWSPVERLIDGRPADLPVSYRVLRSQAAGSYNEVAQGLSETSFLDREVVAGTTYSYRVQSDLNFEDVAIGGRSSAPVEVKVVDATPPPRVKGVRVIASVGDIRVFWDRVEAKDLAGYKIYRREAGTQKVVQVGTASLTQTIFVDAGASADKKLYYAVSAIDKSGNEGRRSEETASRY